MLSPFPLLLTLLTLITLASAFSLHPKTGRPHQDLRSRSLSSNIRARDAHVLPDGDISEPLRSARRVRKRATCNTSSSSSIKSASSSSSSSLLSSSSVVVSSVKTMSTTSGTTSATAAVSSVLPSSTRVFSSSVKPSSSITTSTATSISSSVRTSMPASSSSTFSSITRSSTLVSSAVKPTSSPNSVYVAPDVAFVNAVWPTVTQSGSSPSATVTSKADPYAKSLSYALNNSGNTLFTKKRTAGDLTYYAQGQTACGSVYDDTTFTAAVSELLYDAWPGASSNTNRNPICGPFSPGRLDLSSNTMVASAYGSVIIGGDGLLNCVSGSMCHIPLTATLTYNGKSAKVLIVDRCEGCAVDDIDVTPAVFKYLTGNLDIGRVLGTSGTFSWSFDTNH